MREAEQRHRLLVDREDVLQMAPFSPSTGGRYVLCVRDLMCKKSRRVEVTAAES